MKIAIVSGGTGGHIYPALALADALKDKGHEIIFIGSCDRMEKDVIPSRGYEFIGLQVLSTMGGFSQKIKSLLSICKGYKQCLRLLKGYDMAIGFGNYISLPVMLAAVKLGLKTVIHEQNSYVGRANKFLDKKVDLVIGSYEENRQQFKNKNIKILGNPQSSKAYSVKKDCHLLQEMGLNPDKKTLLIFMGSLGSASVNDILLDYFQLTDGSYQIIYAAGSSYYQKALLSCKEKEYIKVFEHVDGAKVMKNSTLLLSRAGATTLAEVCAMAIPAILIPSPYVPNNHQYYNAKSLADKNAAILLPEKQINAQLLSETIDKVINDDELLISLADNAHKLGNPNVLNDIIKVLEDI